MPTRRIRLTNTGNASRKTLETQKAYVPEPLNPFPPQERCIGEMLESMRRNGIVLNSSNTGVGKCFGKGTPVLMFDGTVKPIEQVNVGDKIMGPDSCPRQVLSLARGQAPMYRIVPVKGDPHIVNDEHIITGIISGTTPVKISLGGRKYWAGELIDISLKEYLSSSKTFKHRFKLVRTGVDFPEIEKDLEVQVLDITRRPEYGILDKQVAIARQQVKLNRSELLPKVGIKGSYDYVHGLELNNKNFLDDASFSVLLNVSIPLFHFGERSNKVRAAKAKLEQTRLQQQNLNEQMLLELTQAANNLDEAKLESELADRSLQQAEENRRVSKSQYEVGLETLSDHLEAQALWQQAYETKVDARFQLYLNYVAYLKAAGVLHDKL